MEIQLHQASVVNERTGEVETPSEFVENLRSVERQIAVKDEYIAALKTDLKTAREEREELVQQLRRGVREGKVLPLLETPRTDASDDDTDSEQSRTTAGARPALSTPSPGRRRHSAEDRQGR